MPVSQRSSHSASTIAPFALAAVLPVFWLLASLWPHGRVWGVNLWAFFPVSVIALLAVVTLAAILVIWRLKFTGVDSDSARLRLARPFLYLLPIIAAPLFWFLRGRTHFLGDGYQILAQLGPAKPLIKSSELGETLAHIVVRDLFGSRPDTVLLSYQILSIVAGLLFVATAVIFAARLFERTIDRSLFILTLATGGYALLFFGYVENYSLFVLAVLWFCLVGMLIGKGRASRFWIIPPLLLAIFLHVMGGALTPAALYLLLADSPLARLSRPIKWILSAAILTGGLVIFAWLYTTNLFFRYSFLPIVPIETTADGYTLFSWKHLLDYVNFRLLIIPASPVVLYTLWRAGRSGQLRTRDRRFLLLAALTATFVTFVLNPKLGMPRDWDLFSFAAIPALLLFLSLTLSAAAGETAGRRLVLIAVLLGAVALGSRVAVQVSPDLAIAHLNTYMELDHAPNRATFQILRDYYLAEDNPAAADNIDARYQREYPEATLAVRAESLVRSGQAEQAIGLAHRAIEINPMYWAGYAGLGYALIQEAKYDSARVVLRIADGLNPNNPVVLHNLGYTWLWAGDNRRAESLWRKAYRLDTTQTQTLIYLVRLYDQEKRSDDYLSTLRLLVAHADAPLKYVLELADTNAAAGLFTDAAALYQRARRAGLDDNILRKRLEQYPRLKNYGVVVE